MAEADLYIDCDRGITVTSATNSTPKGLPKFVQGDTILLRIYLLKGFSQASDYDEIATTGITLQVALGNLEDEEIYAAQYSWSDIDGIGFEAELPMNTTEIDTALGDEASVQATFEIKYLRDALPTTVLQQTVTIYKALIDPASVMPAASPTPLSAEAAGASFVRKIEPEPIYLEGADGSMIKLWNDNGTFRADPVT